MQNFCVPIFAIEKLLHFSNNVISVRRHFFQHLMAYINGGKSTLPLHSFLSTPFGTFILFQTCSSHIKKNTAKHSTTRKRIDRRKAKKWELGKRTAKQTCFCSILFFVQFFSCSLMLLFSLPFRIVSLVVYHFLAFYHCWASFQFLFTLSSHCLDTTILMYFFHDFFFSCILTITLLFCAHFDFFSVSISLN